MSKLENVKTNLEEGSKQTFKRADLKIKKLKKRIDRIHRLPPTTENMDRRFKLKKEVKDLWKQEEAYWGARAKLNWLKWGDKNTKYFHASVMQRRKMNIIHKIKNKDGGWIEGNVEIMQSFKDTFNDLFRGSEGEKEENAVQHIPNLVTPEDNSMLLKEIHEREVKEAVFSLGANKAPGPDGLSGIFYQKAWGTVAWDVTHMIREFFKEDKLPDKINETHITLVPKIPNPEEIGHYRPISCCNFLMKIITRIMALRMKPLMKKIIASNQSAFVEGRQIQDNLVIVHEAFHTLKKKGKRADHYMAIKLDMSKAFDRVRWDFLKKVMLKFGFCDMWVNLTFKTLSTVSYRLKVNGELSDMIIPKAGVRQGDPLSHYLFIIMAEALSTLLTNTLESKAISGISLSKHSPSFNHLFYADDSMLFAKATTQDAYGIIKVLNTYSKASGQKINLSKSGIIFSKNCSHPLRHEISRILHMEEWDKPGKYLGLAADWGRSKHHMLQDISERIIEKTKGWKEKFLNQSGKEILIKAVLQAIPSYSMSILKYPNSMCKKITAHPGKFWWAGSDKEKGIHWC